MKIDNTKRMTLRELMMHAEKCTRDLIEHFQSNMLSYSADFRDLTRPVRRRSHYPTLMSLQNALRKLEEASVEGLVFCDYVMEQLQEIRKNAHHAQLNSR